MLFRSRRKRNIWAHVRGILWPRKGFYRVWSYLRHRVVRLPDTPHRIAAGVAAGVAMSMTPLMGLHLLGAALLAWIMRGNLIASAIGTLVGNPWTFPFIWLVTYEVGSWLTGARVDSELLGVLSPSALLDNPVKFFEPVIVPMLLGSIPFALVAWWLSYWAVRRFVVFTRARRGQKIRVSLKRL